MAVVLNSHENSPVFRDTLDSVVHHWTRDVLVVADAKNWRQFRDFDIGVRKLEGLYHGKPNAPYRNVCLGLMKAWESWGESKQWYCYMEYDCLVGSDAVLSDLEGLNGMWVVGNDRRAPEGRIDFLDRLQRSRVGLRYLLGCCVFLSSAFMKALQKDDFFERFMNFTNFNVGEASVSFDRGKSEMVYDISEYLYPSLCVHYGGNVGELDCWEGSGWRGGGGRYPMRFRPDLDEALFESACVLHPIKSPDSSIRSYHRQKRRLTPSFLTDTIANHAGL